MNNDMGSLALEQNYVGANRDKLKQLILDIYECRDKVSKILELVETSIVNSKLYYSGLDSDELQKKFNSFYPNFAILLNNILTYGEDLEKVMYYYGKNPDIKLPESNRF